MTEVNENCHLPVIQPDYTFERTQPESPAWHRRHSNGNWPVGTDLEWRIMKKHHTALIAAFLMTLCVGGAMLAVSANAWLNKNGLQVANSPAEATATAQVKSTEEAQIQQLQDLVAQYQARETQYQNELETAGQNLRQATPTLRVGGRRS